MRENLVFEVEPFSFQEFGSQANEYEAFGRADVDEFDNTWEQNVFETEGELSASAISKAVQRNRRLARALGWGCVVAGQVRPIPEIQTHLSLPPSANAVDFVKAVARWQETNLKRQGDGQLGPSSWAVMRRTVLTTAKFKPASWTVSLGGQRLGVIEKSAPYLRNESSTHGGVELQFGFRVTDEQAVQRAGFVNSAGVPQFRWIQIVELRRIGGSVEPIIQTLRKRGQGRIIDPTSALLPLDAHPYYWYETLPVGLPAGFHISNHLNHQGPNGLCYDLSFYDRPGIPFSAAQPGRRAYFNFETALVGIRPTNRNVVLNTILWGFDLVLVNGTPKLTLNKARAGQFGGSSGFRTVINKEIVAGSFPGHCFVGGPFAKAARCA